MKRTTRFPIAILFAILLFIVSHHAWSTEKENVCADYLVIKYLLYLDNVDEAEALIDRFLVDNPGDAFILTEKGFIAMNYDDDTAAAETFLKKALGYYPHYYYANYLYGYLLYSRYMDSFASGEFMPPKGGDKPPAETNPDPSIIAQKPEQRKILDEALKHLEISIRDLPEYYDSHFLMGIILGDIGKYKDSNIAFEKSNRLKENAETYYYMAFNYSRLKNETAEIAAYQKMLEINSTDYRAMDALAHIYLGKNNFEQAGVYLEKMLSINPNDSKIKLEYLYTLFASGENDKFLEASENVDILDSAPLVYAKAYILSQREKYDEAEQLLKDSRDKDTNGQILLAEVYLGKQDYFKAFQTLQSIQSPGKHYLYYSIWLHTLAVLDLNRRTIDCYEQIKNDHAITQNLMETAYDSVLLACAKLDRPEKALEVAELADTRSKKKGERFRTLAALLEDFLSGTPIDIQKYKNQPGFDQNVLLILFFYKNRNQYPGSALLLEQLVALTDNPDFSIELSDVYEKQDKIKEAEDNYLKLIERFPSSSPIKNSYAYFLALRNSKLEYALKLSGETISTGKVDIAYLDTYGYILLRLGRVDEALKYIEQAFQKHPLDPEIIDHFVECCKAKNDIQRIRQAYQNAIDAGVDFKDILIKKLEELGK